MKKTVLLILSFIVIVNAAKSQYRSYSDTLTGRSDQHYYNPEYDRCPWSQPGSAVAYHEKYQDGQQFNKLGLVEHTDRRMAVKGIAAMVTRPEEYLAENDWILFYSPNPGKKAEYVYLCKGDTSRLQIRDSARWDTLTPRLWRFPRPQDSLPASTADSFLYCYLFEAFFDSTLLVDSTFIMAGSYYSNSDNNPKTYFPTCYYLVLENYDKCNPGCDPDSSGYLYWFTDYDSTYINQRRIDLYNYFDSIDSLDYYKDHYLDSVNYYIDLLWRYRLSKPAIGHLGPFFAIVDFYQLDVTSDDSQKGWGLGSGRFPDRSFDTISARPRPGYCFVQWSDGNTDNPRIIELTQDTLFTALFDTCTVQDIATPDGPSLPFTVIPNPTTGNVTVSTPADGSYQVALYDMAGRCLLQTAFNGTATTLNIGTLASGSYQLALRSASASGIKVIVKQ